MHTYVRASSQVRGAPPPTSGGLFDDLIPKKSSDDPRHKWGPYPDERGATAANQEKPAPNNTAVTAPPFDPSKPYKVTLIIRGREIRGRLWDVDDGFLRLSPQQQQASVNEIARLLGIDGSITWSYASYDDVAHGR